MKSCDKILVVLTNSFPYADEEAFLETEVNYYKGFKKVFIFPINYNLHGLARKVPDHIIINKIKTNDSKKSISLFNIDIIQEIEYMVRRKQFNDKNRTDMQNFYTMSNIYANAIHENLKKYGISANDRIIFYSYWMYYHSLAALLLRRKYHNSIAVSRCHGYDVFEERSEHGYLPFRKLILSKLDMIFPIANMEKLYLKERYSKYAKKLKVSRLGTFVEEQGNKEMVCLEDKIVLNIVSCSNIISLKRVNKIVEILSEIKDLPIKWTHIGSGNQKVSVLKMCEEKLSNNIEYNFLGQIPNYEVKKIYQQEKIHLFIHMSETEGLPVSFMEAMSYGIPVLSTNVGAINEIIFDKKNGFLVEKNVSNSEAADIIRSIKNMPMEEYNIMRRNAYKTWEKYYNADYNYQKFIKELKEVKRR